MLKDKTLVCKNCKKNFIFTAGEQEFYAQRGFANEPLRCRPCRTARKQSIKSSAKLHTTICADCGKEAKIPFKPMEGKHYYCSECFEKHRNINK